MKKIRIVQAGDFHFDTPNKDVINKEEIKEVFRNIIHYVKEEGIDVLLIPGDMFDNFTLNKETLYFIEEILNTLEKTKVFISPGNHDPYGGKSFYRIINWPNNVHIFKGDIEKVYLEDLDINVWGAAFKDIYQRESLLKDFKYEGEKINIMVIHGEVVSSSSSKNEYNPLTLEEIKNSGMDYIAIGHRHNFSGILKSGNTYYGYAGCPQGRGFDETGDKGIIIGEVSKGVVNLQFSKTSKRNYEVVSVDISNTFGYEEVRKKIINSINEEDRRHNLYKIILKGGISEEFNIEEEILRERLGLDFYYVKVIDNTEVIFDFEEMSKGYSVKGIFVKRMLKKIDEAQSEEDKEVLKTALKYGLKSLSVGKVILDGY